MYRKGFASLALLGIFGCSSAGDLASVAAPMPNLMGQMGGMSSMSSLSGGFLESTAKDSRLSGLLGGKDVDALQPKLSNQLCSMLGGGCAAPLSEDQIAKGATKLTPTQTDAVKENFGTSLGDLGLPLSLRSAVSKAIAPKMPGILGALM